MFMWDFERKVIYAINDETWSEELNKLWFFYMSSDTI
jgi:hypothetical protein